MAGQGGGGCQHGSLDRLQKPVPGSVAIAYAVHLSLTAILHRDVTSFLLPIGLWGLGFSDEEPRAVESRARRNGKEPTSPTVTVKLEAPS